MRIQANENIPRGLVTALRRQGHDVAWIREDAPGIPDAAVLERAELEQRTVLTFDKDFGELALHLGKPAGYGIILLRLPLLSPAELSRKLLPLLESRTDWNGHFSVIERNRVRMIPLSIGRQVP